MDNLDHPGSRDTLAVHFDAATGTLDLSGQSYPENSYAFFRPLIEWIEQFLAQTSLPLHLSLRISYLNTSSTKLMLDVFDVLERHFEAGRDIRVTWYYAPDDEDILATGEDFRTDLRLPFEIVPRS